MFLDDYGFCVPKGHLIFAVKAPDNAHITLSNDKLSTKTIEIVIGGYGNINSAIREYFQQSPPVTYYENRWNEGFLQYNQFKEFWITWDRISYMLQGGDEGGESWVRDTATHNISVGTGTVLGVNRFLTATIEQDIYYVGVSTGSWATGEWIFADG